MNLTPERIRELVPEVPKEWIGDPSGGYRNDKLIQLLLSTRLDLETARKELAAKDREIALFKSVLPGIEWVRLEIMSQGFCPECRGLERIGHNPDCKLAESLSPASGAGSEGV